MRLLNTLDRKGKECAICHNHFAKYEVDGKHYCNICVLRVYERNDIRKEK